MRRYEHSRDVARDLFREAVLKALDETAAAVFHEEIEHWNTVRKACGKRPIKDGFGALDADLPALFKAIDGQLDKIAARLDVSFREE